MKTHSAAPGPVMSPSNAPDNAKVIEQVGPDFGNRDPNLTHGNQDLKDGQAPKDTELFNRKDLDARTSESTRKDVTVQTDAAGNPIPADPSVLPKAPNAGGVQHIPGTEIVKGGPSQQ